MSRLDNGHQRLLAVAGVVAAAVGLGTASQVLAGPRPESARVALAGVIEPTVVGAFPSVSDDGRWIVYEGEPTDGSERSRTIWLRDAAAFGADDVEITAARESVPLGDSVRPTISGDGCTVAFVTEMAYDLFRDDDSGDRWDVYRVRLPECDGDLAKVELVSTKSSADGDTSALDRAAPDDAPAVSQTGSVIAYAHQARDDKDPMSAVTVVDLTVPLGDPLRSRLVAGTPLLEPNTTFRYLGQRQPDVSDDGRFVVYTSDANSAAAVPDWGSGSVAGDYATSHVFVWDRQNPDPAFAVTKVSTVDGVPAVLGARAPVISGNGQYVAFESESPDLAGGARLPVCGAVCPTQVYRYDQVEGTVVLVSREPHLGGPLALGEQEDQPVIAADQGASQATISDDGTQVGFVTRSRNLFLTLSATGVDPSDGDIVVSEVERAVLRRASTLPDRVTPAPGGNSHPALSGSGHVIVFDTVAADVINGFADDVAGRQVVSVARPAQLAVPSLDVGTVAVLLPGPEWYIPVRNDGPSTFLPAIVESSAEEFTITGGTCELGVPVPPGATCTVKVVLTPALPGPRSAELTVSESVFGGTSVVSPLLGSGGEPALQPSFSGLDFPATLVGRQSVSLSSDIENIGFGPANIVRFEVTGDDPDDFVVTSNSCSTAPVNPGSLCSFDVQFVPTESGHRTATVSAFTEFGQYTSVLVNGDGLRKAELETASDSIRAGEFVGLGGSGFRPDTDVTVSWADGRGDSIVVRADGSGNFLALLPTRVNETVGERTLVAQSGDQLARTEIEVLRNPRLATRSRAD
jgi:hypothetical protein